MTSKSTFTDLITSSYSCRVYVDKPIRETTVKDLKAIMSNPPVGPFGNTVRFELFHEVGSELCRIEKLGTYGFIKGARSFVGGAIKKSPHAMEDFGYVFEWFILKATEMQLGTCWLGATFQRNVITKAMQLADQEIMPAATTIGYAGIKYHIEDKKIEMYTKPRIRKNWNSLFFNMESNTPLKKSFSEIYSTALEMVRIAPSATNQQPWRILYDSKSNVFHFVLHRTLVYSQVAKLVATVDLQMIDMGIAMCHFELSARELGASGKWEILQPGPKPRYRNEEYIVSWVGE